MWSQFHYGSIKTEYLGEITDIDIKSQFHYGSIKTIQSTRFLEIVYSLNSTMVRLKHS